jgi:hypothetical protein
MICDLIIDFECNASDMVMSFSGSKDIHVFQYKFRNGHKVFLWTELLSNGKTKLINVTEKIPEFEVNGK